MEERRVLESWKAIASYLGRTEKTCRKWEHELGLPIHRLDNSAKAHVFGYADELDRWKEEKLKAAKARKAGLLSGLFGISALSRQAKRWLIAVTSLLILVIVGLLVRQIAPRSPSQGAAQAVKGVAILPFSDLSPNKEYEYLCNGMVETLIDALGKIEGLRVPARTSAFYFKGKDAPLQEIGKKLNVDYVLEASVQVEGEKLRVIPRLLKVADGFQIWSEKYDRNRAELFATQDDIARSVVDALEIKVLADKKRPLVRRYTKSLEARDLFMKGQHFFRQGLLSFPHAIECFQQAVDQDPNFALAYAWTGISYEYLGYGGHLPVEEMASKAKEAALKALEIDGEIVEAVTTLAGLKARYEWDFAGAEAEFKRAIRINPSYPLSHFGYCLLLSCLGRHEESIAENRKALELDPLSSMMSANLADRLIYARKFDQATEVAKKGLELDPYQVGFFMNLVKTYSLAGRFAEAHQVIARHDDLLRLKGWEEVNIRDAHASQSALVYALEGKRRECLEQIEIIKDSIRNKVFTISVIIAYAYGALGEKDEAFAWLEKAFQAREPYLIYLNVNPQGDSLRDDPRFKDLVRRIGLEK
jgi:TolB-like protein